MSNTIRIHPHTAWSVIYCAAPRREEGGQIQGLLRGMMRDMWASLGNVKLRGQRRTGHNRTWMSGIVILCLKTRSVGRLQDTDQQTQFGLYPRLCDAFYAAAKVNPLSALHGQLFAIQSSWSVVKEKFSNFKLDFNWRIYRINNKFGIQIVSRLVSFVLPFELWQFGQIWMKITTPSQIFYESSDHNPHPVQWVPLPFVSKQ